jgi:formate hydrogenlyase transcriptional activator
MQMERSLAIPKEFFKSGAARRVLGFFSLAKPVLLVCLGYYAGALLGKALRFPDSHLALIWPPTAILLAALLMSPPRRWWLYLIAVVPVHVAVQIPDGVPAWGVISQLLGNFSQALLAAWSVRYLNKEAPLFNNFRGVVAFTLAAVVFAPVVVSSIAAYLYVLSGWEQSYSYAWRARTLSNVLSTIMIVPPIVLLVTRGPTAKGVSVKRERYVEASLLGIAVFLIGSISFSKEGEALLGIVYPIAMPLPVLLWSAVRFRLEGLCLSLLPIAFFAFTSAADGQSFFAMNAPAENVLSLQFYLIATALPLMLLAVLIQERREKEAAVRESEARFRGLVMAGADMVWRADAQGKGFFVSGAWQQLTGQKENEMCDFGWLEAVHPDDRERSRRLWEQAVGQKRVYENELRVRARDGSYRYFHVHAVPILTLEGGVHEWVGANTDITDRKQAESRLKTQYTVTRALADSTSIDDATPRILKTLCDDLECAFGEIWQVNRETHVLSRVEKWHLPLAPLTEFGSTSRQLTFPFGVGLPGRVWQSGKPVCIPDVTVDPNFLRAAAAATAGLRGALGFPILLGDETVGVIVLFAREVREADKNLLQMMTSIGSQVGQFIERKQAEQALRKNEQALRDSEERLRLALKSSRMGVWDWDRRTDVRKWSKEYFEIMGLPPFSVEPSYRAWAKCLHPDDLPGAKAAVEATMAEKKEYRYEYRVVCPDGSIRWTVARGEPIYDENGECIRVMGVLVDVTERKRAEEEIRHLKERLEAENVYLRGEISEAHRHREIIGESEGIRKVLQQVEQVAGTDMTVLIMGETGTGKELVARAVHERSDRRERPLVKVNCSALPGELIESELFGHEKGAFTGATGRQVGRFELADGGTIFLDEVGDLPLKLQAKLLRVLQEGEFERLGSGKTIKVDVRVIAATNRNLAEAMQRGRFRPDLYYRLNVYPIQIPALRERREDIGLLAQTFLGEAGRRLGKIFDPVPVEVLEVLKHYEWPGNVRELQNVIERAAVVSSDRRLQLTEEWAVSFATLPVKEAVEVNRSIELVRREPTLEELERSHILEVLQQTGWRVEGPRGAALILGLNPSTLRSRMLKLGIKRAEHLIKVPAN